MDPNCNPFKFIAILRMGEESLGFTLETKKASNSYIVRTVSSDIYVASTIPEDMKIHPGDNIIDASLFSTVKSRFYPIQVSELLELPIPQGAMIRVELERRSPPPCSPSKVVTIDAMRIPTSVQPSAVSNPLASDPPSHSQNRNSNNSSGSKPLTSDTYALTKQIPEKPFPLSSKPVLRQTPSASNVEEQRTQQNNLIGLNGTKERPHNIRQGGTIQKVPLSTTQTSQSSQVMSTKSVSNNETIREESNAQLYDNNADNDDVALYCARLDHTITDTIMIANKCVNILKSYNSKKPNATNITTDTSNHINKLENSPDMHRTTASFLNLLIDCDVSLKRSRSDLELLIKQIESVHMQNSPDTVAYCTKMNTSFLTPVKTISSSGEVDVGVRAKEEIPVGIEVDVGVGKRQEQTNTSVSGYEMVSTTCLVEAEAMFHQLRILLISEYCQDVEELRSNNHFSDIAPPAEPIVSPETQSETQPMDLVRANDTSECHKREIEDLKRQLAEISVVCDACVHQLSANVKVLEQEVSEKRVLENKVSPMSELGRELFPSSSVAAASMVDVPISREDLELIITKEIADARAQFRLESKQIYEQQIHKLESSVAQSRVQMSLLEDELQTALTKEFDYMTDMAELKVKLTDLSSQLELEKLRHTWESEAPLPGDSSSSSLVMKLQTCEEQINQQKIEISTLECTVTQLEKKKKNLESTLTRQISVIHQRDEQVKSYQTRVQDLEGLLQMTQKSKDQLELSVKEYENKIKNAKFQKNATSSTANANTSSGNNHNNTKTNESSKANDDSGNHIINTPNTSSTNASIDWISVNNGHDEGVDGIESKLSAEHLMKVSLALTTLFEEKCQYSKAAAVLEQELVSERSYVQKLSHTLQQATKVINGGWSTCSALTSLRGQLEVIKSNGGSLASSGGMDIPCSNVIGPIHSMSNVIGYGSRENGVVMENKAAGKDMTLHREMHRVEVGSNTELDWKRDVEDCIAELKMSLSLMTDVALGQVMEPTPTSMTTANVIEGVDIVENTVNRLNPCIKCEELSTSILAISNELNITREQVGLLEGTVKSLEKQLSNEHGSLEEYLRLILDTRHSNSMLNKESEFHSLIKMWGNPVLIGLFEGVVNVLSSQLESEMNVSLQIADLQILVHDGTESLREAEVAMNKKDEHIAILNKQVQGLQSSARMISSNSGGGIDDENMINTKVMDEDEETGEKITFNVCTKLQKGLHREMHRVEVGSNTELDWKRDVEDCITELKMSLSLMTDMALGQAVEHTVSNQEEAVMGNIVDTGNISDTSYKCSKCKELTEALSQSLEKISILIAEKSELSSMYESVSLKVTDVISLNTDNVRICSDVDRLQDLINKKEEQIMILEAESNLIVMEMENLRISNSELEERVSLLHGQLEAVMAKFEMVTGEYGLEVEMEVMQDTLRRLNVDFECMKSTYEEELCHLREALQEGLVRERELEGSRGKLQKELQRMLIEVEFRATDI